MPKTTWNVKNRIIIPVTASLAFLLIVSILKFVLYVCHALARRHDSAVFAVLLESHSGLIQHVRYE